MKRSKNHHQQKNKIPILDVLPDVVAVEDHVERLMWFLLAEVNHSGGALLPGLVADIERLANKAIPRSRAKRPYAALVGTEDHESPFGGTTCT